jgi:LAO/AO transport system kinase
MKATSDSLAERVLAGDRLSLARLLTLIENDHSEGTAALNLLYPHSGRAHLVGITGAPGTGKSTIVNRLVHHLKTAHLENYAKAETPSPKVAVVAVDPSSPFTGGAILGDRIRMRDLSGDPDIFIRSMASRGALGGLAKATSGVVEALDAAGYEYVLIETVGAGQAEVEIARTAYTTVVIDAPGLGDDVQAIKAGILEIADILVVNKADRPGADNTLKALKAVLTYSDPRAHAGAEGDQDDSEVNWIPEVLSTVATRDEGIQELAQAVIRHRQYLEATGMRASRARERIASQMEQILKDQLAVKFHQRQPDGSYEEVLGRVLKREIAPRQAIEILLEGGEE